MIYQISLKGQEVMLSPCKDCKTRFVGCHGNCESYLTWKLDNEKIKDKRRKSEELDTFLKTRYIRHDW